MNAECADKNVVFNPRLSVFIGGHNSLTAHRIRCRPRSRFHHIALSGQYASWAARTNELPRDKLLVVHCKSGYGSSIATSFLRRSGFRDIANLTGGFDAWKLAGLPCAA